MQKNLHLLTSRMSTGRPAETEGTRMDNENVSGPDATVVSLNGMPDAQPNEDMARGAEDPITEEDFDEPLMVQPDPVTDTFAWLSSIQERFVKGLQDKLGEDAQRRLSALHAVRLVVGDEVVRQPGNMMALADYILGEDD